MQIPNSLQGTWNKVSQDKSISTDEYKELLATAAPNGSDEELDEQETQFLTTLNSELKKNGILEKGSVPVGVLSFAPAQEEVKQQEEQPKVEQKSVEEPTVTQEVVSQEKVVPQEKTNSGLQGFTFQLPEPEMPKASVNTEWKGYSKQVNNAFTQAFGQKPASQGKVPVLPNAMTKPIFDAFGAGNTEQFQQMVGAKQDNRFGPETYFRTKNTVADKINSSQTIEDMTKISSMLNTLGNDPEVDQMKSVISQRIQITQNYVNIRDIAQNYFNNVNNIIGKADPNSMDSLVNAKNELNNEFGKLPDNVKSIKQVRDTHETAISRVDQAISVLQGKLDSESKEITAMKQKLVGELNGVLDKYAMAALTTGDLKNIDEGKSKVEETVNNYPKVKDSPDIQAAKKQALDTLDSVGQKVTDATTLINKKDWTKDDNQKAVDLSTQLPPGDLKNKLDKAINEHSEAAKLKEKNKSNLPTTREGLHDVIGNGFWNLENKDGSKAMFQLVAKQGLLDDAIRKMTINDQVEAIKVLTKDVKLDKPLTEEDNFNVSIARKIYGNLSSIASVDKEFKGKLVDLLKKEPTPENFDKNSIDTKSYVNGMKFSIGSDRIGSEQEAALTMARGIMNGEVSKSALGQLNRYELNDLTKFVEKKGSEGEKAQLLKTVAQAYNEDVPVSIESLDKKDKAQVVKNVLDIDGVSEGKISDLLKKAGKKVVFETIKNETLSDKQLSLIGKHVNGDDMADNPEVGGKILLGMIKTYNTQEKDTSTIALGDIRKYINQVDKDWWDDTKTMKNVLNGLGDGPNSEYAKFQKLAPATLDEIRIISR